MNHTPYTLSPPKAEVHYFKPNRIQKVDDYFITRISFMIIVSFVDDDVKDTSLSSQLSRLGERLGDLNISGSTGD